MTVRSPAPLRNFLVLSARAFIPRRFATRGNIGGPSRSSRGPFRLVGTDDPINRHHTISKGVAPRGPERARSTGARRAPKRQQGQISLDFLFGITLFLFTFTYVTLYVPGLFTPFQSESDVTTLQGDKTSIWLAENKLVDDKSRPGIVNQSKLFDLLATLNSSATNQTLLRQEAGLISSIRTLDLNVSVDWLNGTVNASGNATPSDRPVGQTRRLVRLVNTSLNETGMANHVVIHEIYNSSAADAVVLFNPTRDPVDVGGWVLGDWSSSVRQNVTFPNSTLISARGYLTIVRGKADSFVPGCTPDLGIAQTGVAGLYNVSNMTNSTSGNFGIGAGDAICLWNKNGPSPNLVDAVNLGSSSSKCGSVSLGTSYPPATSGLAVARINPGVEGSETSEASENWTSTFAAVASYCPTTTALISVRVW